MDGHTSIGALQWLYYLQDHSPDLTDASGEKIQLEQLYHRGEKVFHNYEVDGYFERNGEHFFYEYNGCRFHKCDYCDMEFSKQRIDDEKHAFLRKHGTLNVKQECQWIKELKNLRHLSTPSFPQILHNTSSELYIKEGVATGELFGFVKCSLRSPDELISKFLHLNFPPLLQRMEIDESLLSPYMKKRCNEKRKKLPISTVVQSRVWK